MPDDADNDDEVLDTGTTHRADRRLVVALALAAVVVVIVALRSAGNSHDHQAAPSSSASTSRSLPSNMPSNPPSDRPTFSPATGRPDACPQDWVCTPAGTAPAVRAMIRRAVDDAFGGTSDLRVTTRLKHLRGHRTRGVLFTRRVTANTPVGPVSVYVYTSATGGRALYFPSVGPGDVDTDEGGVNGFDVSVAVRVVHRRGSTNARLTRLSRDERLVAAD